MAKTDIRELLGKKIGGDYYAADAMESVRICELLQEKKENT